MTHRERALAVLDGQTPDRTPWFGDLSWWYAAHLRAGDLPPKFADGAEGYLRLHREAGVGIYLYAPLLWTFEYDESISVSTRTDGSVTVTEFVTPVGTLRSAARDLPESATSAIVEHAVKGPDDLPAFEHLFTHRTIRPNHAAFNACDDLWGADGIACALTPICTTAVQTLLSRWAGVENTVMMLADCSARLEQTIAMLHAADDPIFRIICESRAHMVVFPENLSGEVTGRRVMGRHAVPYWRQRIAQLHGAGKRVGIHNDGTVRAALPALIEAGFDFVEAATPAPVGDIPIAELRQTTRDRLIVWGGLPGALFSPTTPEPVFRAFVEELLGAFTPGSGFVLGVADQVPPDASFERICAVADIVDRCG